MKRLTSKAALFVLVLVIAACSGSSSEPTATTSDGGQVPGEELEITIENFEFSGPATAAVGETVTITNQDSVGHTWTAEGGEFDSGTIAEGETFEFTFDEAGEFSYFCSIHPQMEGTITVEA